MCDPPSPGGLLLSPPRYDAVRRPDAEVRPMTHHIRKARFPAAMDGPQRVGCYLRVSTGRQAESDLSIPDQRKQVHAFCAAKGWPVVGEYVEPGASATDDNRPAFQKMIERAGDDD